MKTNMISVFTTITCLASALTVVACAAPTKEEPRAKTRTTSSAASTPDVVEEEGNADKITCTADADCDSDERCENGKCVGLDGDRD